MNFGRVQVRTPAACVIFCTMPLGQLKVVLNLSLNYLLLGELLVLVIGLCRAGPVLLEYVSLSKKSFESPCIDVFTYEKKLAASGSVNRNVRNEIPKNQDTR